MSAVSYETITGLLSVEDDALGAFAFECSRLLILAGMKEEPPPFISEADRTGIMANAAGATWRDVPDEWRPRYIAAGKAARDRILAGVVRQ